MKLGTSKSYKCKERSLWVAECCQAWGGRGGQATKEHQKTWSPLPARGLQDLCNTGIEHKPSPTVPFVHEVMMDSKYTTLTTARTLVRDLGENAACLDI